MAKATPAPSWATRWRRRQRRSASDWADLGTAFGLEMSMQPTPADAAKAAPAAQPAPGSVRWWQRLARRGGSMR